MPKSNQKDAYYFPHDYNARNDPKILALRSVFGAEGYGVYWMMIERLREQPDYKLQVTKYLYNALAMQTQVQKEHLQEIVEACCNDFVEGDSPLLVNDGQYIYSSSLLRRMQRVDEISETRREAAQKRWGKKDCQDLASESGTNAKQMESKKNKRKLNQTTTPPISPSLSSAVKEYLKCNISPQAMDDLTAYETTMGTEVCLRAIEIAVDSGKPTWVYINGILRRWSAEGVTCTADIEALDLRHDQQKRSGVKYHPGAGATVPQPGKPGEAEERSQQDRERLKKYLADLKAEDETMGIEF